MTCTCSKLSQGLWAAARQLAELVGFACTLELGSELGFDHCLPLCAVTFDLAKP